MLAIRGGLGQGLGLSPRTRAAASVQLAAGSSWVPAFGQRVCHVTQQLDTTSTAQVFLVFFLGFSSLAQGWSCSFNHNSRTQCVGIEVHTHVRVLRVCGSPDQVFHRLRITSKANHTHLWMVPLLQDPRACRHTGAASLLSPCLGFEAS